MATEYIHELGDSLSTGASSDAPHVKVIAPEKYKVPGSETYKTISVEIDSKYTKPSGGIPKSDLASAVQTSLNKADSALQSESDPVFSASAAAGISSSDITDWNSKQPGRLVVSISDNTAFSKISAAIAAGKDVWLNTATPYEQADYTHYVPMTEAVVKNSAYTGFVFSRPRPYSSEYGVIDRWTCRDSGWEALDSSYPKYAETADYSSSAGTANSASNADLGKTTDATNGDVLYIGGGTQQRIGNAGHANSAKDYDQTGAIATALNSKQNTIYFTNPTGGTTSNPAADKAYVDNSIDTWVQSNQGVWEKYRSNGVYITGGTVTYDNYLIQRLIYSSGTPNRVVALLTSDQSFLLTPVLSSGTSYTAWTENVRIMLTLINLTSTAMTITARCGGIINPSASGTAGRAYGHIAVDGHTKDTEGVPSSWPSGYHNDLAIGSVVANGSRTWEVWWRKTAASTYDSFSLNIITIK